MKKRTKRCIAVAAGTTAAIATVNMVRNTWENLAEIAMDRNLSESNEQTVLSAGRPVSDKGQERENRKIAAADQLSKEECTTVTIHSYDGICLTGHLYCVENPQRTIIAVHGWRSSWGKDFGIIADFLCANDCNVLYVEQRAHGASEGNHIGFGLLERYDILEWIDWINAQEFSSCPVYLFGMSMGAATVLMTAGEELSNHIHGVIADSGYTSPHDEWKYIAESNLHYSYKLMEKYMDKAAMERIGYLPGEYSSTVAMQECKTPVLFIHGTDDHFVPVEMTYENYKACAAPKRLLIVPGAGHCLSYLVDQEKYEGELLRFWQDFDCTDAEYKIL
ncbi:MAG: alpha/beta hydrolase [Lachnospiraceae bacterium]|nr:alpha/beta hydrolase [Lachnospiraceae bacterium]